MRKIFLILILAFLAFGALQINAQESVKVKVKTQESTANGNLRIRFAELINDSRCPADVTCVWAGNAKISVRLTNRRGASKTVVLNSGMKPQSIVFSGYEIKFRDLNPRLRSNVRINPDGYVATFEVTRL